MGRRKIKIQPITDEKNRQVHFFSNFTLGDVCQEKIWINEKGL
jgi:hypothetical protein